MKIVINLFNKSKQIKELKRKLEIAEEVLRSNMKTLEIFERSEKRLSEYIDKLEEERDKYFNAYYLELQNAEKEKATTTVQSS